MNRAACERLISDEDNLAALMAYEVQPLFWSRRQEALPLLNGG
jgi:hypothetical protein